MRFGKNLSLFQHFLKGPQQRSRSLWVRSSNQVSFDFGVQNHFLGFDLQEYQPIYLSKLL